MSSIKNALREIVVETGRTMIQERLTIGSWGNISVRDPETGLIYISPSGMAYPELTAEDVVVIDPALAVVDGFRTPSVEKAMHAAVYRARPDLNAVVHTHALYSSVLGVNHMALPPIGEDLVELVGDRVLCSEYALPGSEALAQNVAAGLGERNAVILPNHGALCAGESMPQALTVCRVLEKNAQVFILARCIGTPQLLEEADIQAMQRFAREVYGQPKT